MRSQEALEELLLFAYVSRCRASCASRNSSSLEAAASANASEPRFEVLACTSRVWTALAVEPVMSGGADGVAVGDFEDIASEPYGDR